MTRQVIKGVTIECVQGNISVKLVRFVVFNEAALDMHARVLEELAE